MPKRVIKLVQVYRLAIIMVYVFQLVQFLVKPLIVFASVNVPQDKQFAITNV